MEEAQKSPNLFPYLFTGVNIGNNKTNDSGTNGNGNSNVVDSNVAHDGNKPSIWYDEEKDRQEPIFHVNGEIVLEEMIRAQITYPANYLFVTQAFRTIMDCRGAKIINEQATASLMCRLFDKWPAIFETWQREFIPLGYTFQLYRGTPEAANTSSTSITTTTTTRCNPALKDLLQEIVEAEAFGQPLYPKLVAATGNNLVTNDYVGSVPSHLNQQLISITTRKRLECITTVLDMPTATSRVGARRRDGLLVDSIDGRPVPNHEFAVLGLGVSREFMCRRGEVWPFQTTMEEADQMGILGSWEDWINWDLCKELDEEDAANEAAGEHAVGEKVGSESVGVESAGVDKGNARVGDTSGNESINTEGMGPHADGPSSHRARFFQLLEELEWDKELEKFEEPQDIRMVV
ncbi:hypothetical protein BD289DRAFT_456841 [Coniella lustricola]|uniref:Uncharacterized protein n=1 Tax=Coniella lustricola TaxID=2025994 RepID=A0A2T2ZUC3_9PEZI|nr:hypothetical protein BD289DRAFT_456841 [Coniella lustricola]